MNTNYELTELDLLIFYKRILKKTSFLFKNYVFVIVILIAFILSLYDRYSYSSNERGNEISSVPQNYWIDFGISLFFLLAIVFIIRIIIINSLRSKANKRLSVLGKKELEITDDKLLLISKEIKTEYNLTTFLEIEDHREYYYLYHEEKNALIIPKKSNNSAEIIKLVEEKTKLRINVC